MFSQTLTFQSLLKKHRGRAVVAAAGREISEADCELAIAGSLHCHRDWPRESLAGAAAGVAGGRGEGREA